MEHYAVIDIGTLKVKFLIATPLPSGEMKEVYFSNTLTCFGCDMDKNNGNVKEEFLQRTIDELLRCKQLLEEHDAVRFRVVSTHALRRAKNKEAIVEQIRKEVGFDVENISQEQEGELFFRAVMEGFPSDREYAVMDIGGGSVQILVGNQERLRLSHLIQTGAQYLHDNFTSDPSREESFTTEEDLERMRKYILEQFLPLERMTDIPIVYGSTCIIDLMKAIGVPLEDHPESFTHPYKTYAHHLEGFTQKILPLSYGERERRFPFQKGYMWGIDKAFLNISIATERFASPYIIPSNANVAQGIILSMAR